MGRRREKGKQLSRQASWQAGAQSGRQQACRQASRLRRQCMQCNTACQQARNAISEGRFRAADFQKLNPTFNATLAFVDHHLMSLYGLMHHHPSYSSTSGGKLYKEACTPAVFNSEGKQKIDKTLNMYMNLRLSAHVKHKLPMS